MSKTQRFLRAFLFVTTAFIASAWALQAQVEGEKGIERVRFLRERFDGGEKWAVVIGVNDYSDGRIPDLRYCVADAKCLARTLTASCGYPEDNVLVLTDDQEKAHLRPSRVSLLQQVASWLKLAKRGDTVLVFFSGHGFLDDRGQGFLAAQNSEVDNLGLTSLRTDDLRDMLRQCKASQKLLVLDCCHAGGDKAIDRPGPSSDELGRAFRDAQGLITLASCGKDELSREWDEKQQGLFTFYLTEGLSGKADRDKDGLVTSDELYSYTQERVSRAAISLFGATQQPRRIIGEDVVGVFPLARAASPTPSSGRKFALCIGVNNYTYKKELVGDNQLALAYANRDAAELALALRARGFAEDDVVAMTTSAPEERQPLAANIRRQLQAIVDKAHDGDDVVVTYSGIEMQFADDDEYYLLPADARVSDQASLLPLSEVCDLLARSKGGSKIVILDSCRIREGLKDGAARPPRMPPRGVAVLFACSSGGNAFENKEKESGLFTYFVRQAINGAADANGDGAINSREILDFTKQGLAEHARTHPDERQAPTLFGETNALK